MRIVQPGPFTLTEAVESPTGTASFPYPEGYDQSDFRGPFDVHNAVLVLNDTDGYLEVDGLIDISYGESAIIVTNKTGYTWPIGTIVFMELSSAVPAAEFYRALPVANLAGSLTGTTEGVMTDVAPIALSDNEAINTAVNTAIMAVNLQLKELQVKLNETITALRDAYTISK